MLFYPFSPQIFSTFQTVHIHNLVGVTMSHDHGCMNNIPIVIPPNITDKTNTNTIHY